MKKEKENIMKYVLSIKVKRIMGLNENSNSNAEK